MAECCGGDYAETFDVGFAARMARRYRRRGLTRPERRLVDFLAEGDLRGATVLEIGGGVGEIGIELLRRGAASVTALELSSAYDEQAAQLATEAGLADRVHRRIADIATSPEAVEPADLVVLHRVVCCYRDVDLLLTAAADHCRTRLAFSHPRHNPVTRVLTTIDNAVSRLRGTGFQSYLHSPTAMLRTVESRGMRAVLPGSGWLWQVQGLRAA